MMEDTTMAEQEVEPTSAPHAELPKETAEETLQQELGEMKDKYLRVLADSENSRKRLAKEKQEMTRLALENAVAEFLPAIDSFEHALRFADSASGEVKNWAMGFQMILSQFKEVLHNHGIVAFHSEGNQFDPAYHDAVEILETDEAPEGTILQEFTKGYKSALRTLRPARVKVAKRKREDLD